MQHCFLEQNQVADAMAKEGAKMLFLGNTTVFEVPSMFARGAAWVDILGTTFARNVKPYNDNNANSVLSSGLWLIV